MLCENYETAMSCGGFVSKNTLDRHERCINFFFVSKIFVVDSHEVIPGPPTSSVSNLDFGLIHDGGLSTGALVEQVQLKGDRLQYKLLIGEGADHVNHCFFLIFFFIFFLMLSCGGFLVCFFSWGDPHKSNSMDGNGRKYLCADHVDQKFCGAHLFGNCHWYSQK